MESDAQEIVHMLNYRLYFDEHWSIQTQVCPTQAGMHRDRYVIGSATHLSLKARIAGLHSFTFRLITTVDITNYTALSTNQCTRTCA